MKSVPEKADCSCKPPVHRAILCLFWTGSRAVLLLVFLLGGKLVSGRTLSKYCTSAMISPGSSLCRCLVYILDPDQKKKKGGGGGKLWVPLLVWCCTRVFKALRCCGWVTPLPASCSDWGGLAWWFLDMRGRSRCRYRSKIGVACVAGKLVFLSFADNWTALWLGRGGLVSIRFVCTMDPNWVV